MTDRDMRHHLEKHDPPPPPNPGVEETLIILAVMAMFGWMVAKIVLWLAIR